MSLDGTVGEMVELVTDDNTPTGTLVARSKAHAEGLLHRTVYAIIQNSKGEWLLQRRHDDKAIAGGCWDLSAAEHLNPGEEYPAAALRGMQEELGVGPAGVAELQQILPPTRRSLIVTTRAGKHISDQEFVPVFLCRFDGEVTPDQVEVSAVRWAAKEAVVAEVQADASKFTPWFVGAPPLGPCCRLVPDSAPLDAPQQRVGKQLRGVRKNPCFA